MGQIPETEAERLTDVCREQLSLHERYIREHFEDMPEVRDWRWSAP